MLVRKEQACDYASGRNGSYLDLADLCFSVFKYCMGARYAIPA